MSYRAARNFFLTLFFAAALAAGVVVSRSPDTTYAAQELVNFSSFRRYDALITRIGKKQGVDPMLIKAVIWRESTFHPNKVGKNGERGLMQVTEAAASDWARKTKNEGFVPTDLFMPEVNIECGTWYLKNALGHYTDKDDPMTFALAEYNAGKRRVDKWLVDTNMGEHSTSGDLRDAISIPSTRDYVEKILARYHFYKERGRM